MFNRYIDFFMESISLAKYVIKMKGFKSDKI